MITLTLGTFVLFCVLLPLCMAVVFHLTSRLLTALHPRHYRVVAHSQDEFVIQASFFPCYWHFLALRPTLQSAFIHISVLTHHK